MITFAVTMKICILSYNWIFGLQQHKKRKEKTKENNSDATSKSAFKVGISKKRNLQDNALYNSPAHLIFS